MWVLGYLPDLESDFSAFHRVDDIYLMSSARFFILANRLPAYQGVLAARVMQEQEDQKPAPRAGTGETRRVLDASHESIRSDPALAGIVAFGGGG
jgi:hypothetical protein